MADAAKILVIGSNSFSGQDFVDLMLDDPAIDVIGVSRRAEKADPFLSYTRNSNRARFRFFRIDLNRDMDAFLRLIDDERPDHVVNFAAQSEVGPSWEHPEHWFETNTVALARLVNHLRGCEFLRRYLHVSSPEAYGSCVGTVTEETPDNPSTPYAASKSAADMLIDVYFRQYGFPAVTVRATNVYGARQQLFKIVCRSIIRIRKGEKIRLDGGGVAVKSYIHIRDVSRGERSILFDGTPGERYHLSPDAGVPVRDLVATICRMLGVSLEAATEVGPERPGQDAAYVIDSTKARRAFDWRPEISLEDGLQECVDWVDAHWEYILTCPHDYEHTP